MWGDTQLNDINPTLPDSMYNAEEWEEIEQEIDKAINKAYKYE